MFSPCKASTNAYPGIFLEVKITSLPVTDLSVWEEYFAIFGSLNYYDGACQKSGKYIRIYLSYTLNSNVVFWDTVYLLFAIVCINLCFLVLFAFLLLAFYY